MKYIKILMVCLILSTPFVSFAEHDAIVEGDGITRTMTVPYSDPLAFSPLTKVIGDTAYIKIYSALTGQDELCIYEDIQLLLSKPEIKNVKVYLNSHGGGAYAGFAIGDQFVRIKDKFKTSVWASGIVASAAVMVFLSFDNRYASENTFFMVHEVAVGSTTGMDASSVKTMDKLFDKLTDRYVQVLVKTSNITEEDWKEKIKETTWFSVTEAKEWGLVTEVK
jgi:ATP-dependent protease ClpP protease subunit